LECFLNCHGEEIGSPDLFGKAVVPKLVSNAKGLHAAGKTADVLQVFSVFSWILTEEQRLAVQALIVQAVQTSGTSATASASSSSSSGAAVCAPKAKATRKDADSLGQMEYDSTMALFRKKHKT
jgi:hypothetical protein